MSKTFLKTAGVFAALVLGGYFAQAQVNTAAGVPVYKNTGNDAADQARYESEKEKWYLTHFNQSSMTPEQKEAEYYAKKEANALQAQGLTAEQAAFIQNKQTIMATEGAEGYEAKARELGLIGGSVKEISQAEFNTFPAEKQAHIKANPSLYRIVNTTSK